MMEGCDYRRAHMDSWMLFCVVLLVGIGVVMNFSASAVISKEKFGNSYYFLERTLVYAGLGFGMMIAVARFPYENYRRLVYPILIATLVLVCAVFVPGIGKTIGGATRWIGFGPLRFQPSEAAKVAMIIFLAYSLEKKSKRIESFAVGFAPHLIFMLLVAACILLQKDFGSASIIAFITWIMMFVAGVRVKYLAGLFVMIIPLAVMLISGSAYRRKRILAFLNPWDDQYGSGFQMIQSFVAINQGGWFGRGLGQGQQKLFYLPEAHTDFIFSVIGEEMGLAGVMAVIALFAFFCYRGLRIALLAPDMFGRYLAVGTTMLIGVQAILNMGVVMGLLPTKGLTLPFVSYGGSSLIISLVAVGILLNVSTYKRTESAY